MRPPSIARLFGILLLIASPAFGAATEPAGSEGASPSAEGQPVHRAHAIAMHGDPKYAPDFHHFGYVNPDAPKGGTLRTAEQGTFDSFNREGQPRRRRRGRDPHGQ